MVGDRGVTGGGDSYRLSDERGSVDALDSVKATAAADRSLIPGL